MGWENEYEGLLDEMDEMDEMDGVGAEELKAFLSEDGEARRRFLKQALLTGGGLAAANLLSSYRLNLFAQTTDGARLSSSQTEPAEVTIPVTLRVNGRSYPL